MTDRSGQVVALGIGPRQSSRLMSVADLGDGPSRHVLRVALALRGGVSLAVWIGGAVAELDVARRVRIHRTASGWDAVYVPPSERAAPDLDSPEVERARVYGRLLAEAGFDAMEIDVLAGASAGGLNAVVYAVAQRAGASVNPLLDTWQEAADIRRLLQPPGFGRVDSLLRGDYYFWPRVTRALHELHDEDRIPRNPMHRSARVSIDLAATIIDSADRSVPGSRDSRGYFHFSGSDADDGADIGRGIPREVDDGVDLARLAYAARSTSSYPGAFEPALIFSTTKLPGDAPVGDTTHIDMSYAFSGHRPTWNHPFRVIDGSILDEVPVDQAFTAARRSASDTPSSRLVLYLDPSPPAPSPQTIRPTRYGPAEPARGPLSALRRFADRQSRVLNVLRGGRLSDQREPGGEEIAHIERFRLALLRESARGDAYATAQTEAEFNPDAARRAYVRYRASTDVQYLSTVTGDPSAWQNTATIASRSIWPAWDGREREDLEAAADARYSRASESPSSASARSAVDAIAYGPQGVLDAALCGLTWVRALERLPRELRHPDTPIPHLRVRLYRVLGQATDARDAVTVHVLDAGRSAHNQAIVAIDAWIEHQGRSPVGALWQELDALVELLRSISPDAGADESWSRSPFSVFARENTLARDLAPFLAPRGIPEPISSLSFERLTADEPPAHPEQFAPLIRRRQRRRARIALSLDPADITDETLARLLNAPSLTADDKLSGSLLFNFGGFLSRTWRANDWWWGRLDASAAIVRILSDRATTPAESPTASADIDSVQSAIFTELANSSDAPLSSQHPPRSTEKIRAAFEFGADTLDNLTPEYRLALSSRAIRIASRALTSSIGPVGRVLVALTRPFAVALPVATTPLRAAMLGAVIGLAIAVSAGSTGAPRPSALIATWPAHLVAIVIAAAAMAGFLGAWRRWGQVIRRLHHVSIPLPPETIPDVAALRTRALAQGGVLCAVSVATAATASAVIALGGPQATWWILASAATVIAIHGRVRSLNPSPNLTPIRLYAMSTAVYVLWAALIIAMPAIIAPLSLDHRWVLPFAVVVAAAVSSALLTIGWLRTAPTPRGILANPFSTSILSAAAGAAPVWVATRVTDAPFPTLTIVSTVIIAVVLWGTVLWWLPEIPPGPTDSPTDDDSRRPAAV